MARRRHLPSIAVPITFGAVAVPATTALLVGWTVLLGRRIAESPRAGDIWLLVVGAIAFAAVITILVLLTIFLAREIREVRRQDSFIDSVTHELKSPLASLKLCAETLGRDDLGPPQQQHLREMMLDDVDRLAAFIDDVLQASRLAHEGATLNVSDVDLTELVPACVAAVAARHHLADDRVAVTVEPGLVVSTDRPVLEIVLKNLLDNAVKYSGDAVDVRVRARRGDGGALVLEVEDRGIGIARADLRRVFHRFYRADQEGVRTRRGTGLGLFVVWALIRNLGGAVTAHSAGVGRGTTLRVVLPDTAQTGRLARDGRGVTGRQPRLLVVEDEDHLAAGLKLNLDLEGYAVDVARNAREARQRLAGLDAYDAIVLDVMLPDLDGFALCRQIREAGNYVPVVMLTARAAPEDRVTGLEAGADDYLVKPFALRELLARVRSVLRRREWERGGSQGRAGNVLVFGNARVDFDTHEVSVGAVPARLTQLEIDLLRYFADNAGRVVSRDELLEKVWKLRNYSNGRTVDNFISRLRRLFEAAPQAPVHFVSVRGAGYRFVPAP